MSLPEPHSSSAVRRRMAFRLLRLAALMAVVMATIAIVLLLQGRADGRATALIAMALGIGLFVLIGLAVMIARQLRKDDNDTRP